MWWILLDCKKEWTMISLQHRQIQNHLAQWMTSDTEEFIPLFHACSIQEEKNHSDRKQTSDCQGPGLGKERQRGSKQFFLVIKMFYILIVMITQFFTFIKNIQATHLRQVNVVSNYISTKLLFKFSKFLSRT